MRDPNRIPQVLAAISLAYAYDPDARLMQLLINALGPGDHFYVEDEEVIEKLDKLVDAIVESRR